MHSSWGEQVDELVASGISTVHVDLMDGHYVPNLAFGLRTIADLRERYADLVIDVHMMVSDPARWIDELARAGASAVSFHADSTPFVRRTVSTIQDAGMKAGVAINPSQPVTVIEPYATLLDYVVLMSVEPGFAGQRFLPGSLERLEELSALRERLRADFAIEIDGGVDHEIAAQCLRRGAQILVTGVFVTFQQDDGIGPAVARFAEGMQTHSTHPDPSWAR